MEEISLVPFSPIQKRLIGIGYIAAGTFVSAVCAGVIARSKGSHLRLICGNLGIIVLGSYIYVTALVYIPQSEASALGGLETLWVRLISRFTYGEKVSKAEWGASAGVLLGCALVALASPPLVPPSSNSPGPHLTLAVGAYLTSLLLVSHVSSSSPLSITLSAAIIGGFTDAMAKAFEFSNTSHLWGVASLTFAFAQISLLNIALATGSETTVLPLYKSVLALSAILVGGAAFSEFREITPLAFGLFILGTAVSLSSAAFLAASRPATTIRRPLITSFSSIKNDPYSHLHSLSHSHL